MQGSPVQFELEDLSPVERRLTVTVARELVNQRLDAAFRKVARDVNLPGFRKGKAPRELLERLFARRINQEVASELVQESFHEFTTQHPNLRLASQPTLEQPPELRKNEPLRYSFRLDFFAEVEAHNYDGLEATRRAPKVTDADVERALKHRQEQMVELVPVEGRDRTGPNDVVELDLQGQAGPTHYKEPNAQLDLSEVRPERVPGLRQALTGLPINTRDHEIRLPLPPDLAGPGSAAGADAGEAVFKVTIRDVREKRLPKLDDDFARDTGDAETLEELRGKVREQLLQQDQEEIRGEVREQLLQELVKRNPVPVAPGLVQRVAENLKETVHRELLFKAIATGAAPDLSAQKVLEAARAEAIRRVSTEQLLESVAKKENLEVTGADLEMRLAELAKREEKNVARLRAELQKDDPGLQHMRQTMLLEKTLDLIESRAKIKDSDS